MSTGVARRVRIAVVVGSTRPGRKAKSVAEWVLHQAEMRDDADFEIVDLADHPLPLLDEPVPASLASYEREHTRRWSDEIARFDGFVFVTPEYNHSMPGVLKNAIDFLYHEWKDKAVAFVGYGTVGGARAIEQLRLTAAGVEMASVRNEVSLSIFTDFVDKTTFQPQSHRAANLTTTLNQLVRWTAALAAMRATESN